MLIQVLPPLTRALGFLGVFGLPLIGAAPAIAQSKSDPAQTFPNRAIHIVVPLPAGGPTDINARIIGQKLSDAWGQPVIIENRPGASTGIGAHAVATSAPDGYTLLAAQDTTLVMNPATGTSMAYDPFKDFETITLLSRNISLLAVREADGPKSVKELIKRGKASTGKLNFGTGIITARLAGFYFAEKAGIDIVSIPYKGSTEVVQGLLSKSVDFIIDGTAAILPIVQSGQARALAKMNGRPLPSLPKLQSLSVEAGLPDLRDMVIWVGLVAPAGTPPSIVEKIHREVVKIYDDPTVIERLEKAGISPATSTPREFDELFRAEADRWTKFYKTSSIKLN